MRTALVALFLTTIVGAVAVRPANACSCLGASTPCQDFEASVVFVGEVESVRHVGSTFQMRLRVTRALKGIKEPNATLYSDAGSSCGVRLEPGRRYVVYTGRASDGRMSISACSPTRELAAGEPAPELPPVPRRVYGTVALHNVERIRSFRPLNRVRDVRLWLDLPAGRVNAVSDGWGRFTFDNVPVGTYRIGVDAGRDLTPWMAEPVRMSAEAGCAEARVVLQPSGVLSGRVVAADGKPAGGINVYLFADPPSRDSVDALMTHATTAPDGRFGIAGVRAGTYVLSAGHFDGISGRTPHPPAYFGGRSLESAERIAIGPGRTVLTRAFALAPALAIRQFTIAVSCRDGSIPPIARADARPASGDAKGEDASSFRGALTLTLLRDTPYTLEVSAVIPHGPPTGQPRPRQSELLSTLDLPARMPGRHLSVSAPFENCKDPLFHVQPARTQPGGAQK